MLFAADARSTAIAAVMPAPVPFGGTVGTPTPNQMEQM